MLIRVIDLETTAETPETGGVCEVGWVDLVPARLDPAGDPTEWRIAARRSLYVDPGCPIPPETSAIHHIVDADVRGADLWSTVAGTVFGLEPRASLLVAHSAKFERLWCPDDLTGGVPWGCTYKAALRLWPDAPRHGNQALRYWRRPETLIREFAAVAHRALPDAYVTAHLLMEMFCDGLTIEQLVAWTSEPALQVRCHIGKWRGALWTEVDDGMLSWIAARDFDEDVHFTVRHEQERRRKLWEAEEAAEREVERRSAPADADASPF